MTLRNAAQLICYPDRIGRTINDLREFLEKSVGDAVGGLHLLPFYPSNADGGFAPITHKEVDSRYGNWDDIARLAERYDLCADLTVNHISDESREFQDYLRHGRNSRHAGLFVDVDALGEITQEDLHKIHIRKEKEPFRKVQFDDGSSGRVWCTFTERQIDLDYRSEQTYRLMEEYIAFLTSKGVKLLRLDAFGYTTKRIGTSCFLVEPDVYRVLEWINDTAARYGAECLPEVHDHPSFQYAISRRHMHPYAFALPPLVLYSLLEDDSRYLKHWLRMCPRNAVTVLDTHDGICIPDVEGVLPQDKIEKLINNLDARSADPVLRRTAGRRDSVGAIYQLTCTFYDALMRNDDSYIAARALQFFTPGIPQVYYVGLLAGCNDEALMEKTGELRDINRHYYSMEEADQAVDAAVVRRLLTLMRFRSSYPAFDGHFELNYSDDTSVAMAWRHGEHHCLLTVDLLNDNTRIDYIDPQDGSQRHMIC